MVGALFDMGGRPFLVSSRAKETAGDRAQCHSQIQLMAPETLRSRTGLWVPQRECRKGVRRRTPGPDCTSRAPKRQLPCELGFSSQSIWWASPRQCQDEPRSTL